MIEIPVMLQSLKLSILSLTSFQMDNTFCSVVSDAVEQLSCKADKVAQEGALEIWLNG